MKSFIDVKTSKRVYHSYEVVVKNGEETTERDEKRTKVAIALQSGVLYGWRNEGDQRETVERKESGAPSPQIRMRRKPFLIVPIVEDCEISKIVGEEKPRFGVRVTCNDSGRSGSIPSFSPEDSASCKVKDDVVVDDDDGVRCCSKSSHRMRIRRVASCLWFESAKLQEKWFSFMLRASVSSKWPEAGTYFAQLRDDDPLRTLCLSPVPSLRKKVPKSRRRMEFTNMLKRCSVSYKFDGLDDDGGSSARAKARSTKTFALEKISAIVAKTIEGISLDEYSSFYDAIRMIESNLFRCLPDRSARVKTQSYNGSFSISMTKPDPSNGSSRGAFDDSNAKSFVDPSWDHVHACHILLRDLVLSTSISMKTKKRLVKASFLRKYIDLFRSRDKRERAQVKLCVHRVYATLTNRRGCIRSAINDRLYQYLHDPRDSSCVGISEILEFLVSIVNGFGVPLRDEHLVTLRRALVPLHKTDDFVQYHDHLRICIGLFVSKDPTVLPIVVNGMIRVWPNSGSVFKVRLFLDEIDDLFESVSETEKIDPTIMRKPLSRVLLSCLRSDHFDVSQRAMRIIHSNANIRRFLFETTGTSSSDTDVRTFVQTVRSVVNTCGKTHWNAQARQRACVVLSALPDDGMSGNTCTSS